MLSKAVIGTGHPIDSCRRRSAAAQPSFIMHPIHRFTRVFIASCPYSIIHSASTMASGFQCSSCLRRYPSSRRALHAGPPPGRDSWGPPTATSSSAGGFFVVARDRAAMSAFEENHERGGVRGAPGRQEAGGRRGAGNLGTHDEGRTELEARRAPSPFLANTGANAWVTRITP